MTVEQLEANYGHHHPEFQEEAVEAFGGRIGTAYRATMGRNSRQWR
jgi:hypothetical protein